MATAVVLAVLAVCVALALRSIRKNRLLSRCGGDCAGCAMDCERKKPR